MSGAERLAVSETGRKLVHIAFGLGAFALRYLTWTQALTLATLAFVHNRFLLPMWVGRTIARSERGHDTGILVYPAVVFVLILVFRHSPWIAAAAWAILAFGDGIATLVGRTLRSPALPWNRAKSVAGLVSHVGAGSLAALAAAWWTGPESMPVPWWLVVLAGAIAGAAVESLPLGLDDNITQTTAAAVAMGWLANLTAAPMMTFDRTAMIWLVVNLVLAVVGWVARSVTITGAIAGFLLGGILIVWGGWPVYVALLLFFGLGSGATRLGWKEKSELGIQQEEEGRRGARHALANVGAAATCVLIGVTTAADAGLMSLAAVAALATATADTTSSEIGQWLGKRAFLPTTLRPVARGTEGAISVEGTAAGALGALLVATATVPLLTGHDGGKGIAIVTVSAVAAAYLESLLGNWNRRRAERIPNTLMNFLNTAAGALLAILLAALLQYQP